MPNNPDKLISWRPRIRLRHLFVFVTLSAVLVWMWPQAGIQLDHQPGKGSRAAIVWNGEVVEIWNSWPPPAPANWTTVAIPGPDGLVKTVLPRGTSLPAGATITGTQEFQFHGSAGTATLDLPVVSWPKQ